MHTQAYFWFMWGLNIWLVETMLCCISSSSTVDDGITETSEERRQRIVPGFNRPESELDGKNHSVSVAEWRWVRRVSKTSQYHREPSGRKYCQTAPSKACRITQPCCETSNDLSEAPPVNVSKKKKQGLFAKKSSKNRPGSRTDPRRERDSQGISIEFRAGPPSPPVTSTICRISRPGGSRHKQPNNSTEQPNGQVHESTHRKAIPLHGNLQLNFSVPGRSEQMV